MALTCPGCRAKMVEVEEEQGLSVDVCDGCGGLWLDAGELEKKGGKLPAGGLEYRGERRCPRCDVPMLVRPSQVVELDRCPGCGGLFFDAGEIELLIRANRVALKEAPQGSEKEPTEPRFLCDLCHQFHPLTDRVMGEQLTVCPACAQKQEIRHDPSARRKAELEREQLNTPSNAPSIFSDESNIVVDLLVGRSHWGGSHRHGLIDLLFRLLR